MEVEAGSTTAARGGRRKSREYSLRKPEFPGCHRVLITRDRIADYEGRFEFWDAATETAWVVSEPTGIAHEHPSQRLAALCAVIGSVRGSPIECFGSTDLELRDENGERQRIMQADQIIHLHPERAHLPDAMGLVVGEHDLPDVVLEVDNTTDVRRGKLWLYEEWGFPEIWVDVPERRSPSRPAGRFPGLTIHLLEDGEYRTVRESRAFPGWTATAIHVAMNEPSLSMMTTRLLDRVGRSLGARDGTGPDDTPWLRAHREQGRARGRAEGRDEGRAELVDAIRRRILAPRGISDVSDDQILDALLERGDQADFWSSLDPERR